MLDSKYLRSELTQTAERLATRGFKLDVAQISALEEQRRELQVATQELQNQRNSKSKNIGQAKARVASAGGCITGRAFVFED